MADETTLVFELSNAIPMTCANATGIEKGATLTLTDPFTATQSVSSGAAVAGIAAAEKIASDGITTIPVYRDGIFKAVASGACTVGDPIVFESGNRVSPAATNEHFIAGIALETAAAGESLLIELRPGGIGISD